MSYKIVVDSCCELPSKFANLDNFEIVPLTLEVGDTKTIDDETFNQAEFLAQVMACPTCPKSACPSPGRYAQSYEADVDNIYVVTLSSNLSGSYNSAVVAKEMYLEEHEAKNIFVVDSLSASVGEMQMVCRIVEMEEAGLSFEEICEKILEYRDNQMTYFVLDNLDTLRKNGRMSKMKSIVASTLSVKPVLYAVRGEIAQKSQAIGSKKALNKLVDIMIAEVGDTKEKRLAISHCNCPDRATYVRKKFEQLAEFKDAIVLDTRGVSTMYANDGGIIVTIC